MIIHIACSIDEGYVMPLCGMLSSLFMRHQGIPTRIHVLTGTLSTVAQTRLEQFMREQRADFHQYAIPDSFFQDQRLIYSHFSKANFYRLLIPELVMDVERMLYLDVDILVRRSLVSLYSADLKGHPVAAVSDAYPQGDCHRLDIPDHLGYFNSGVLVMDLPTWRRERIAVHAMDYLTQHNNDPERCRYADQDGLNVVLQGRWLALSETWNFNIYHCSQDPQRLPDSRLAVLREGPAIIHFADHKKPWKREYALPFQKEFLQNARLHGVRFRSNLTLANSWARFLELRQLRQLQARYRQANVHLKECF